MTHGPDSSTAPAPKGNKVKKIVAKIRGHQKEDHSRPKILKHDHTSRDHIPFSQLSLQLWMAAYDALKNDTGCAGLVLAYEATVSQELPGDVKLGLHGGEIPAEKRLELMGAIAAAGLKKVLADGRGNGGDEAREILVNARLTVEEILELDAGAAVVAWAGICILTPLLLDPLLKHQDMKSGLIYLTTHIPRFMALSLALHPTSWSTDESYQSLKDFTRHTLLDLYRKILEFEMNCVCAAASSWNIAAKNVVDWTGWQAMATAIREADEELEREMEKHGTEQARKVLCSGSQGEVNK